MATRPDPPLRIPLSVPHLNGRELDGIARALASNWVGPLGPEVDGFETEFAESVGARAALATASGTAAIHLALRVLGVEAGDEVLVSSFTFCASANPVLYQGGTPVFVDAEDTSWNMAPDLLADELDRRGRTGRIPSAVVVAHLYGQTANMAPILEASERWGVPVVEDAAEALGARFGDRSAGTLGRLGAFSFDASKMITTSMGGMLVSDDPALIQHARKLARQAREPVVHYEHRDVGYNYRMSNLLAAVGRAQLGSLGHRVEARRRVFQGYAEGLADLPGVTLQAEVGWGFHARWLTCIRLDPEHAVADPEQLRSELWGAGIESRPVWKPLHMQPVYRDRGCPQVGGDVSERLFREGLCLPSSSSLTEEQVGEICGVIREVWHHE